MFRKYHLNCDPYYGRPVAQKHGDRYVVVYPPSPTLTKPCNTITKLRAAVEPSSADA